MSELPSEALTIPPEPGFLDENGDEYLNWTITSAAGPQSTLNRGRMATRGASQIGRLEVSVPGSDLEFYKLTYRGEIFYPVPLRRPGPCIFAPNWATAMVTARRPNCRSTSTSLPVASARCAVSRATRWAALAVPPAEYTTWDSPSRALMRMVIQRRSVVPTAISSATADPGRES